MLSSGTIISAEDMDWNERFESLLNFADEFGHCNVPLQREYPLPSGNFFLIYSTYCFPCGKNDFSLMH